jgi:N-acetylglucosamine-6-sulfatase
MATERRRVGLRWVAAAAAPIAIVAAVAVGGGQPDRAGAAPPAHPNIVVIITDDQTMGQLTEATMPRTLQLIGDEGTTFANAIATTPLCCPSRASMLTGQYGHNNGVLANRPGYGALSGKRNTLPAWLERAGYRTAHVGRWLNGYRKLGPAPGWDTWFTLGEHRTYFDYDVLTDDGPVHFGKRSGAYVTRVLNRAALGIVRRLVGGLRPFYLQLDHVAPHSDGIGGAKEGPCAHSAIPPSRTPAGFEGVSLPMAPSFDEEDISDKPPFLYPLPRIDEEDRAEFERQWRCRLASLPPVDEGLGRIYEVLAASGELSNTAIFFISDNGFFFGEHRIRTEKYHPYEEAIRIPFMARFPQVLGPTASTIEDPVANIDLPPTILELAGARPCTRHGCRTLDGRSLLGLAQGQVAWPERGLLVELDRLVGEPKTVLPCQYEGIRVDDQLYVEHTSLPNPATGVCEPGTAIEHYDLGDDPFELQNLFPSPSESAASLAQQRLSDRLAQLRDCAGIEGRDPAPESGHYCE